jgi:Uma2 family endonuclease
VRFSVADVQSMMEAGILPEDATTELLHGIIVLKDRSDSGEEPTMIGRKHRIAVNKLTYLAASINSQNQHVQIQNPLICGDDEAPEPDFAVIRGPIDRYQDRLPNGADATCVIEVADSSLERDLEEKLEIYAAGGVQHYVVLNLRDRTAIEYRKPNAAGSFAPPTVLSEHDTLSITLDSDGRYDVAVRDLLP